jgi:ApaG protein
MMVGSYGMEVETGEWLEVAIPAFSLDSPHQRVSLN